MTEKTKGMGAAAVSPPVGRTETGANETAGMGKGIRVSFAWSRKIYGERRCCDACGKSRRCVLISDMRLAGRSRQRIPKYWTCAPCEVRRERGRVSSFMVRRVRGGAA